MLATKINGFNQTGKCNISKPINKQVSFKEREDEFSPYEDGKKIG